MANVYSIRKRGQYEPKIILIQINLAIVLLLAELCWRRLRNRGSKDGTPVLLTHCDRLIQAHQSTAAVPIWNALCERKLIHYTALKPEQGISLTNGDFAAPPLGQGFDWQLSSLNGIILDPRVSQATLSVRFLGKEPEAREIISQFFRVVPNRRYRLRFLYQTSGIALQTGLRWQLFDPAGKQGMQHSAELASNLNTQAGAICSIGLNVSASPWDDAHRRLDFSAAYYSWVR